MLLLDELNFLEQLSADSYADFIQYSSKTRRWKPLDIKRMRESLNYSPEAYAILLRIYSEIPGADWVDDFYEPTCEQLINHDAADWITRPSEPCNSGDNQSTLRGVDIGNHCHEQFAGVNEFKNNLLTIFMKFVARTMVRFTDDEHVVYAAEIRDTVNALLLMHTAVRDIPLEVFEWIYLVFTRTSVLLRPKLQSGRIRSWIGTQNSLREQPSRPHAFLDGIDIEFPQIAWRVVLTANAFTGMCKDFADNMVLLPYQTAIGIMVLQAIGLRAGFDDIELPVITWLHERQIQTYFDSKPHHYLDGILVIACVLAQSSNAGLSSLVALIQAARLLELQKVENDSRELRSELEYRFIRAPIGHAELESASWSTDTEVRIKESLYLALYSRATRMN